MKICWPPACLMFFIFPVRTQTSLSLILTAFFFSLLYSNTVRSSGWVLHLLRFPTVSSTTRHGTAPFLIPFSLRLRIRLTLDIVNSPNKFQECKAPWDRTLLVDYPDLSSSSQSLTKTISGQKVVWRIGCAKLSLSTNVKVSNKYLY